MIPKKPVPDLIRDGYRLSEKIMLRQNARAQPLQFEAIAIQRVGPARQRKK
jgi:hypothetical protein